MSIGDLDCIACFIFVPYKAACFTCIDALAGFIRHRIFSYSVADRASIIVVQRDAAKCVLPFSTAQSRAADLSISFHEVHSDVFRSHSVTVVVIFPLFADSNAALECVGDVCSCDVVCLLRRII